VKSEAEEERGARSEAKEQGRAKERPRGVKSEAGEKRGARSEATEKKPLSGSHEEL
jgi:hypothetical protein